MNLGKAFAKLTANDSDQPQQDICQCQVCAIKESQCQEIKQCSGCNVSKYCSRSCQRVDWVTHKPDCRALSKVTDSDTIHLDSRDLLNLNACIEYALRNMPNVKHVHLLISEEHKVRDEDCNNYEIKESDEVVLYSYLYKHYHRCSNVIKNHSNHSAGMLSMFASANDVSEE